MNEENASAVLKKMKKFWNFLVSSRKIFGWQGSLLSGLKQGICWVWGKRAKLLSWSLGIAQKE
jgi:hypothetical protein